MLKRSAITFSFVFGLAACGGNIPERSSTDHSEAVRSFYVGLAALDVGDDRRARTELEKASSLAPGEPAAWNNLGVLQLRQRDLAGSRTSIEKAASLAAGNSTIRLNLATLALQQGDNSLAAAELERAIRLGPEERFPVYMLADLHERETRGEEALQLYRRLAERLPKNLAVRLEVARLEAKLDRPEELKMSEAAIGSFASVLSHEAREQLAEFDLAVERRDMQAAASQISFLRNVLLREAWFRDALAEFKPSETAIGVPIHRPLVLPAPEFRPAEPDRELGFEVSSLGTGNFEFAVPFYLNGEGTPPIAKAAGDHLLIGSERIDIAVGSPGQIAAFDLDYDFRNDLAVASRSGFRLFRQSDGGKFAEATDATKLGDDILKGSYDGVWPFDVEHDGDLDLLLSRVSGPPVVLQNNSDGTFKELSTFTGLQNIRSFAYADIDEDGDADALFLTADGRLRMFTNERGGKFVEREGPNVGKVSAFAVGDINGDGKLDVVTVWEKIHRITDRDNGKTWDTAIIEADVSGYCSAGENSEAARCTAFIADMDNNGANDLVIGAAGKMWVLSLEATDRFVSLAEPIDVAVFGISDRDGDGKLDIIGLGPGGPVVLINQSRKNYRWQVFRPRAGKAEGDQRVNSFGIGGEMEIRTGVRAQKQLITTPQVHFGMGEAAATDVLRIIWNNGFIQAEFDLAADQAIAAEQRLKGSCPHLFAWNGERFVMVKDAPPWSPALGLKINAQDTFGIVQTEEWFKVPGEMLRPKDGFYELRVTAEYWESFYMDHYRLLAVDHRDQHDIFTDERFAVPPPPLKVFTYRKPEPFASVFDHNGLDSAGAVRSVDAIYLDGIKRGRFQGVAEDHWVELSLPEEAPPDKQFTLIADGWLYPTDASINVQLGQSSFAPPRSLSIEVPDANGGWTAAKENLGFPAGKMKTVLLELPAGHRKFRLRTNMEIYWDRLAWAETASDGTNHVTELGLSTAELRYRGFSVIEKRDASSPEIPLYDRILTTGQRWRDLEGYYTRFGDVRELLAGTDGRMVLMNAGDELVLRFPELPAPAAGLKRDFVLIGNGWIKDGDLNSVFSRTLLPLPSHDTNDYSKPPGRLEDDPVFLRYRQDWLRFHTRYVAPDHFRRMIRKP